MSSVETRKFEPATGTAVNLGASGDAVTLPAGVTLQTNTIKDAGGNTIFTSDGAGTLSSVNSGLQGGMVFISSQTASGSSSIDFTSGIDGTYDEYMFVFTNIHPATDDTSFMFQVNATDDAGGDYDASPITSTSFEARDDEDNTVNTLQYVTADDQANATGFQILQGNVGAGETDESTSGILHIFSPSSTTYVKHFYSTTVANTYNVTCVQQFTAGYINDTTAIDQIRFKMSSGNMDAGTIYLYGIK